MKNGKLALLSIFVATVLAPYAVSAESVDGDRFSISLGVFLTDRDTEGRLDADPANTGTDIDFEKDLGLESSDAVFRVDGYYRFNERHRADFSVFDLSRDNTRTIQRELQWGDDVFAIDTVVNADFDLTIYKAAYTYSFLRRDSGYLGVTLGLYVADVKASLAEQNLGQSEVGDITAPLPVIGLRGEYQLSGKWKFRASGEFFAIEFEDVDGSLIDLYAGIDYQLLENMSLGFGLNSVQIDVDASKSSFNGTLDWQYDGGLVFFKFDF